MHACFRFTGLRMPGPSLFIVNPLPKNLFMVKRSNDEPGDKASERLQQMYEARFPNGNPEEQPPLNPAPAKDTPDPAKKKAAKKTSKKKK